MSTTRHEAHIGKEDIKIQGNTSAAETFTRRTSTGAEITLYKVPDMWDGTGLFTIGKMLVKAADHNATVLHSFGGVE